MKITAPQSALLIAACVSLAPSSLARTTAPVVSASAPDPSENDSQASAAAPYHKELPASAAGEFKINLQAADIKLTTTASAKTVAVSLVKQEWSDECKVNFEDNGKIITFTVARTAEDTMQTCDSEITISAPAGMNLTVEQGTGNLQITGSQGNVEAELGAGDMNLSQFSSRSARLILGAGNLNFSGKTEALETKLGNGDLHINDSGIDRLAAKSGAGSVFIKGSQIRLSDIDIGVGDLDATLKSVPHDGHLNFSAGSGNASVSLPKGAQVTTEASTMIGNVSNEFSDGSESGKEENPGKGQEEVKRRFNVRYKTAVGDLTIKAI